MICPECKCYDSTVIDSRMTDDGMIRRRRKCLSCGVRQSTVEIPIDLYAGMQERDDIVTRFLGLALRGNKT